VVLPLTPPVDAPAPVPHPGAPPPGTVLPPHYSRCYACGDEHPGGLHLSATVGSGVRVAARFTVTDLHQGAPGLAHGGLLAAAMDETLGYLLWLLGTPAVTARLEVDYRLPVPVGTELLLAAECLGVRGRKVWSRGTATLPNGRVAVRAEALFLAVGLEHFTRHGWGDRVPRGPDGNYNP